MQVKNLLYSYQTRFDYWFATNSVAFTGPLAVDIDANLKRVICNAAGFNIFEAPPVGTPCPNITSERIVLKCRNGGLGLRPYEQRYLLLNSLNNTLPQAIDRVDESGTLLSGLWNSLASVLGRVLLAIQIKLLAGRIFTVRAPYLVPITAR